MSTETKQWASNVGPRLTKTVSEALEGITNQHGYYTERTGVKGVNEKSWGFFALFGASRKDVGEAWTALGDKYGWTIERENMGAIIAEAGELVKVLVQNAPCNDKTITAEEDERLTALRQKNEQDRQEADRQAAREREEATATERKKYPWAIQTGTHYARGSANLKRLLAEAFPGIAFSVTSKSYSGGCSIDVHWTDGPASSLVDAIAELFCTSTTEQSGGDSITVSCHTGFTDWMGGAKYVHSSRTSLDETEIALGKAVCKEFSTPFPEGWPKVGRWEVRLGEFKDFVLQDEVNRLFHKTSFPAGAVVTGLDTADRSHEDWVVLFWTPPAAPAAEVQEEASVGSSGNRVVHNKAKGGVEIWFAGKPPESKIAECRAAGFRPSRFGGWHWYHKYGAYAWAKAHTLAGVELPAVAEPSEASGPDAFDMAVEDRMAEAAGCGGFEPRD